MDNYRGEYPVIMIDFKGVKGRNFQEIVDRFKSSFNEAFNKHLYLLESPLLKENVKEVFKLYIDPMNYISLDLMRIKDGIKFLSVLVFIDEYDTPINNVLENRQFPEEDLKRVFELLETIMGNALKSNRHLEKGLVTGILRLAKSDLSSSMNNFVEYNFFK